MGSSSNGFIGVDNIARSGVWNLNEVSKRITQGIWNPSSVLLNNVSYNLANSPLTITTPGRYILKVTEPGVSIKVQLWGAGGGISGKGGAGGYASGIYTFSDTSEHILLVGEAGQNSPTTAHSAYPDGGLSIYYGSSGGGSSRFGPFVTEAAQNTSTTTYYLIAGGGGGGHQYTAGPAGAGGGTSGQAGTTSGYGAGIGGGGTQSAGGAGGAASSYGGVGNPGIKYKGGDGGTSGSYGRGSSGGGGYYGGGAGGTVYADGGGGSGYVDTSFITSSVLTGGSYTTPVQPAELNRPSVSGGSAQNGAIIITRS